MPKLLLRNRPLTTSAPKNPRLFTHLAPWYDDFVPCVFVPARAPRVQDGVVGSHVATVSIAGDDAHEAAKGSGVLSSGQTWLYPRWWRCFFCGVRCRRNSQRSVERASFYHAGLGYCSSFAGKSVLMERSPTGHCAWPGTSGVSRQRALCCGWKRLLGELGKQLCFSAFRTGS